MYTVAMIEKIKDFGEITLTLFTMFTGVVWFIVKKGYEYMQLKKDIVDIQAKLDLLLSKQSTIILDIELIKKDITHLDEKYGNKEKA
jgi:hypothetical protein